MGNKVKKIAALAGFLVGCAVLVAAIGIGWANWGRLANQTMVMQTMMGASIAAAAFLVIMAVISKGRDRWRAMMLASILLLLGLLVWLFDIGLLFAPIPV